MTVRGKVEEAVARALVEALELDPAEIRPEARVMVELGAESIDVLDIRFRLEESLQIAITDDLLRASFGSGGDAEQFRQLFTVGGLCDWLVTLIEAQDA